MNRHELDKLMAAQIAPAEERDALWRGVQVRLQQRRSQRQPAKALLMAAAVLLVVGAYPASKRWSAAPPAKAAGPLLLSDGVRLPPSELAAMGADVSFDEQSALHASAGARVQILDNTASRFAVKQTGGKASYQVTPGGPRRWTVETPLGSVEVVGTSFTVDASEQSLSVSVEHGVVIVRGELVPEHAKRLEAGESIEVHRTIAPAVAQTVSAPPQPAVIQLRESPKSDAGETEEHARVSELFSLVDTLRRSGRSADAVTALEQIVTQHAHDERAAMAAFTWGRIEMDSLGQMQRADLALSKALALGLDGTLAEDATLRRAKVLIALGRGAESSALVDAYLRAHPSARARFAPLLGGEP